MRVDVAGTVARDVSGSPLTLRTARSNCGGRSTRSTVATSSPSGPPGSRFETAARLWASARMLEARTDGGRVRVQSVEEDMRTLKADIVPAIGALNCPPAVPREGNFMRIDQSSLAELPRCLKPAMPPG